MALDKELIEILACPQCKDNLTATEKEDGLICSSCRLIYPVKEDIPILLVDEAAPYKPPAASE